MTEPGAEIRRSAEVRYASGDDIWAAADRWNDYKRAGIERFCRPLLEAVEPDARILNAGAGSHRYDWLPDHAINLDRFAAQVEKLPNPVVGDLENLPFGAADFDVVVCVGPVINYTSAMESRHSFAPVGLIKRWRPPESAFLNSFAVGLSARIAVSVSMLVF